MLLGTKTTLLFFFGNDDKKNLQNAGPELHPLFLVREHIQGRLIKIVVSGRLGMHLLFQSPNLIVHLFVFQQ